MSNANLTTEERRELDDLRRCNLTNMSEEEFRRLVDLARKERGAQSE